MSFIKSEEFLCKFEPHSKEEAFDTLDIKLDDVVIQPCDTQHEIGADTRFRSDTVPWDTGRQYKSCPNAYYCLKCERNVCRRSARLHMSKQGHICYELKGDWWVRMNVCLDDDIQTKSPDDDGTFTAQDPDLQMEEEYCEQYTSAEIEITPKQLKQLHQESQFQRKDPCMIFDKQSTAVPDCVTGDSLLLELVFLMIETKLSHEVMKRFVDIINTVIQQKRNTAIQFTDILQLSKDIISIQRVLYNFYFTV